jgi:MFS family permease
LQAIVAMALFAPGVLAPRLGLSELAIALFSTACFAVGMAGALWGGALVARFGSLGVASACMVAVIVSMALGASGSLVALLLAGLMLGLAFGPETPASSALLGKLARPEQRSTIFSIRQTGNQIGAIIGSLTLPTLALLDPRYGYLAVAVAAGVALVAFQLLRGRYDGLTRDANHTTNLRSAWALVREDAQVRQLAVLSVPFSAMQLALNVFLVSFLVATLGLGHVTAGLLLGVAQAGGLLGRLSWGVAVGRIGPARNILAGLGLGMSACALMMSCLPPAPPVWLAAMVAFLFGLTASGWNGVFLAEVARCAPAGRVAEATGGVLTASYAGLCFGPMVISALATVGGLRMAYATVGLCCGMAAVWMMIRR